MEDSVRSFMSFPRTECDCSQCSESCKFIPGYLLPEDLFRIGRYLGHFFLSPFIEKNFLASPGALVAKAGRLYRIRTIVPARQENGWCRFFDGRLCTIHPVSPFGCAFFDSHQTPRHSQNISALGLMIIAAEWQNEESSNYCQAWHQLHRSNFTAPPPEECRRRMQQALQSPLLR